MLKMYVVVSSPLADIGKGWVTASIAKSLNPIGAPIKIDPALIMIKNHDLVPLDISQICSDALCYKSLGLVISSEQVIRSGEILVDFINQNSTDANDFSYHNVKRLTFADASLFLADKIVHLISKNGYKNIVFEIGGNIYDSEHDYVSNSIRIIANILGIEPRLIVLTYFDNSDDPEHYFKTNIVIQSISKARKTYWEPWRILIRNRSRNINIEKNTIELLLEKIVQRAMIINEKLIFIPEFTSIESLSKFIENLREF